MSIICAFQFNVEVERGALRSLIGGMSNRFPGNRVSRDRPVLPQLPLRRQNGSKLCFKGIPRVAAEPSSEDLSRGGGTNLAEVYAVRIDNIDGESPGDLYGTVIVTDHKNIQTIFDRKSENAESIGPGENALLIGPTQAILASEKFSVDVALFDGHSRISSPDDTPISKGQISWSFNNNSTNKYEEPISDTIVGANGSATVVYAVLKNAVQASVVVTMIAGSSNDGPSDVYGNITASNTNIPTGETMLFRKTPPDHTIVNPGDNILLDRSIVPVPLGSNLIVHANLFDYETDVEIITNGIASFPVKLTGISDKKILGKLRNLEVKVTWTNIIP